MPTTIAATTVELNWKMRLQRETMARLAHAATAIEGNPLLDPVVVSAIAHHRLVFVYPFSDGMDGGPVCWMCGC
jgi:Fic family protein